MPFSKLGRNKSQRRALLRTLMTDLIVQEKIMTTESKAKELQKLADKMVTLSKKNTLHTRRQAKRHLLMKKSTMIIQFCKNYLKISPLNILIVKVGTLELLKLFLVVVMVLQWQLSLLFNNN